MSKWLEWKYLNFLSSQLPNFKLKSNRLVNMSCPFCRELETSSKKRPMRGYVFDAGEHFNYYCHRCGKSMIAPTFIKRLNPSLYADYIKEKFSVRGGNSGVEFDAFQASGRGFSFLSPLH